MPRARKNEVPPGQPYGDRQRLEQAMAEAPPQGGVPVPQAPQPQAAPPWEQILGAAVQGPTPLAGGLAGPSKRPGEPITTGASFGPGAGPEASPMSQQRNLTAQALQRIGEATGDDAIIRLAMIAARRGA
jgi:hypothetical protein